MLANEVYSIGLIHYDALEALTAMPLVALALFLFFYFFWNGIVGISIKQAWTEQLFFRIIVRIFFVATFVVSIGYLNIWGKHIIGYKRQQKSDVKEIIGSYRFIEKESKTLLFTVGDQRFKGSRSQLPCYPGFNNEYGFAGLNERTVRALYTPIGEFNCVTKLYLVEK